MIWVDGYKWPPELHGTGSEDYLNQAWGMQDNAFLRNGSSIHENNTNGYQTSYVHHLENPVHFQREIKATIEHGHGNHLCNEMSSVAYWYAAEPTRVAEPPTVAQRLPVLRDDQGQWLYDPENQITSRKIRPNAEMEQMKTHGRPKNRPRRRGDRPVAPTSNNTAKVQIVLDVLQRLYPNPQSRSSVETLHASDCRVAFGAVHGCARQPSNACALCPRRPARAHDRAGRGRDRADHSPLRTSPAQVQGHLGAVANPARRTRRPSPARPSRARTPARSGAQNRASRARAELRRADFPWIPTSIG